MARLPNVVAYIQAPNKKEQNMPTIKKPKLPPIDKNATLTSIGIPAFLSDHIKDFLKLSAVKCHVWNRPQIMQGLSPITFTQACDDLKSFDDKGIYAMAPSVIQSPLSKSQMVTLCTQMFTSEWYVRRELMESGLHIPDDILMPLIQEMTQPNRTMSEKERQMALSYRASLLKEV